MEVYAALPCFRMNWTTSAVGVIFCCALGLVTIAAWSHVLTSAYDPLGLMPSAVSIAMRASATLLC